MIDPRADRSAIGVNLNSRDFESAGSKLVQDMLESGAVDKREGEGRYVLVISRITNDTMQRIDTDQLVKLIRVALLKSGKVVTTTAVGLNRQVDDPMSRDYRELRRSREFDTKTMPAAGRMVVPELSLSGKLMQHNNRLGDGSQRIGYDFQLTLTFLRTGLGLWEGTETIAKRAPNQSVAW